jgi:hypothetical protein
LYVLEVQRDELRSAGPGEAAQEQCTVTLATEVLEMGGTF